MTDELNEIEIDLYHDPETGQFLKPDGTAYPYSFFPNSLEFHTSKGEILTFRDFPSRTLLDIQQRFQDKYEPKIPTQALEIGEGEYTHESNPDDPRYLADYDRYVTKLGIVIMSLYFSFGLNIQMPKLDDLPEDFLEWIHLSFEPTDPYLKHHMKRKWVERAVSNNQELDVLYRILQGHKLPTWEGIVQSAKRFQGDSERVSDTATQHAEAPSEHQL